MNYLLFFLSLLLYGVQGVSQCDIGSEFVYELPDGFAVTHTFKENGLLTAIDDFGNGTNMYIQDGEFSIEDLNLKIVEEETYEDGSRLITVDNPGPVDPYNAIFIVPGKDFIVVAYLYKSGDSLVHGAFEEKAVNLARSIAQGGKDGKAWNYCFGDGLLFHAGRDSGQGSSADVSAVQVR